MKTYSIPKVQISYVNDFIATSEQVKCSEDSVNILLSSWDKGQIGLIEEFKVLFLNRALKVIGVHGVSKGGTAGTVVDCKIIFSAALVANAHSIILAHNHPSGGTVPSIADNKITAKIVSAGKLLDISVLDHIIVTPHGGYYSFADEGKI